MKTLSTKERRILFQIGTFALVCLGLSLLAIAYMYVHPNIHLT